MSCRVRVGTGAVLESCLLGKICCKSLGCRAPAERSGCLSLALGFWDRVWARVRGGFDKGFVRSGSSEV